MPAIVRRPAVSGASSATGAARTRSAPSRCGSARRARSRGRAATAATRPRGASIPAGPTIVSAPAPPASFGTVVRNSSSTSPAVSSEAFSTGPPSHRIERTPCSERSAASAAAKSIGSRAQVLDLRRAAFERRARRGDHDDARVGVLQQRQVARQVEPAADDDRERIGRESRGDALLAAVRVAHEAAVALGAHGAGADHHGVHARAQRVKQLAVGDARHRRGAPVDGRAAVGGGDHVQRDVRPSRRCARGEVELRGGVVGRQLALRRQQPAQRDERLVAQHRHAEWPGSMCLTSSKYNSSPGSCRAATASRR